MTRRNSDADRQLSLGFLAEPATFSAEETGAPGGYKGLYRFHKYWGKKPHEPLAYIIDQLTKPGDIVLDPFSGTGTTGREALLRSRKFVGFDINPVAVELTRLLLHPPTRKLLHGAIRQIEDETKSEILASYLLEDGKTTATHYLWNGDELSKVWVVALGAAGRRRELPPSGYDLALIESYAGYRSKHVRQPRFFTNSRINAAPSMTLDDVLTGRAQRNIDLLLDAIERCPESIRPALKLCLTAASGQMTKMVFAVTGRGKTTGNSSDKTEVGSWVIGYWRPRLHFEVNAWNCFEKRTSVLLKAVADDDPLSNSRLASELRRVTEEKADAYVGLGDCRVLLDRLSDESVSLIITDPPHSDRMPYLELSEFWNSILGFDADFDREIVLSNAKERGKTSGSFREAMADFLGHVPRVLKRDGVFVLLFNAREREEWSAFRPICERRDCVNGSLDYLGFFPCNYSARSVVQDNRKGSLKSDLALVFARAESPLNSRRIVDALAGIPEWSSELPCHLNEVGAE